MLKSIIAVLAILFSMTLHAEDLAFFEKNLGKAPSGFQWKLCHNGFLALRKPDGWHFKEEGPSPKGTISCFISKEKVTDKSDFSTGFSINIIPKFYEKAKEHPSLYAKRFIGLMTNETKETGGKIDEFLETNNGPLKGLVLRTTRMLPDKEGKNPISTTVHHFLVANDKTSTLYISSFESPSAEWTKAWTIGEKIVEQLGILSNK